MISYFRGESMSNVGKLIKEKRTVAKLSQKNLGKACGISDSEIMKIENGTRKTPNWVNLCKIAKVLGMHPFDILLAAGYISENDFNPNNRLHNLEKLDDDDCKYLQLLIDFMISRKETDEISKGGL